MRAKLLHLLLLFIFVYSYATGQNISYEKKMFYTAKVYGFVKYYHSEVSVCRVNWDSIALAYMPSLKNASTVYDFNSELVKMLNAAGPTQIAGTSFIDSIDYKLKRNLNFNWINDAYISSNVKILLDTIKNNYRPHAICWFGYGSNDYTKDNAGWLSFPKEQPLLNVNTNIDFPDESNRMLMLFKLWNIMNYLNPNNYILDKNIDTILAESIIDFTAAQNAGELFYALKKFSSKLDDAHVNISGKTGDVIFPFKGKYKPKILVRHIENQYVVAESDVAEIKHGDVILKVDGFAVKTMEDSLRKYISAGSAPVFHRYISNYLLEGIENTNAE